jgi:hypothetical protein
VFLATGSGQGLVSRTEIVSAIAGSTQPILTFDVGFATDELFGPGRLFDSFSISVAGPGNQPFAALLTADASGVLWAPATEGGFPLNGGTISRLGMAFPEGTRTYLQAEAYRISWPLPSAFRGDLSVTFDLFDNLDGSGSLAYFTTPTIVPEPTFVSLLALGTWLALRRKSRS